MSSVNDEYKNIEKNWWILSIQIYWFILILSLILIWVGWWIVGIILLARSQYEIIYRIGFKEGFYNGYQ